MFNKNLKNVLLVIFAALLLSACSTAKKSGDIDGDVYTGSETVKYLASGVPDRIFFATNKSSLTTASRSTLRKQATYLRKNKDLSVTIEGHADERGTREYNLALAALLLSACSTAKKSGDIDGDVYTGSETVKYLASGVPDRIFFATNKSSLTTASRSTLRKQATYLRKNKDLSVTIEGHADERGTREYNLALGERRANAARDYLMTYGISGKRISVISYGKEKPVNPASTPLAWSQNRRSVTVKVN